MSATWPRIGRLVYGVAAIALGVIGLRWGDFATVWQPVQPTEPHRTALSQTAEMVPRWLPPDQRFWAIVTGACHLLAAAALLTGIRAQLAARLLTVMLLGFGALVWAPRLVANPGVHMTWAGNAVNLAIAGAAWVVADA